MYQNKNVLAMIPARGGSKGLPGKNTRMLSGKPLIAWTIETAKKSRYIDRIIVSTDSAEIADISREYGAEVPFTRPAKLAKDSSRGIDVAMHAIEWAQKNNVGCDIFALLQPTSPLRTYEDIDTAVELLLSKDAGAIVSVCITEHHPYRSNTLPPDGSMKDFRNMKFANLNRQELPSCYRLNGAVYIADAAFLKKRGTFIGDGTYAYIMPRDRSIDIDDEIDFDIAEMILNKR